MTAQLPSKARLERVIQLDDIYDPELTKALARFALAAHEQEPIYQVWDDGNWADYDKAAFEAAQGMLARSRIVYAHPAPVPAVHLSPDTEYMAEQAECVSMMLDECNVPKSKGGHDLSLWGRVVAFRSDKSKAPVPAVPDEWRSSLQELVKAMRDYEMDVDEPAPYKHREMMRRAEALLNGGKS